MTAPLLPPLLESALRSLLGPAGYLTGADTDAHCADWRGLYRGRTPAVLRPANAREVGEALALCHAHGVAVVPQGGNTGMVGGAVPSESGDQVVLTLSRLNRVRDVDPVDMVMEVEAGVPLAIARQAAEAADCLLPLTFGSEGTAQVGGALATNAGGNNTLRYGNARDLVLGLEVAFADGRIWNGLRRLRKDNTGYCLRQLILGSEGTLGIITAATLKLSPRPAAREVALCALASVDDAVRLLHALQRHDAGSLQAFEYISGAGMDLVLRHIPGVALPLADRADHYVLLELATGREGADLAAELEAVLGKAIEAGWVRDAVVAASGAQRSALWKLREEHSESQKRAGANVKNDVSVPISRIARFIAEAGAACEALVPGIRVAPFGHLGDGNIHFNLVQPEGADGAAFLARQEDIMAAVNEVVRALGGSFSAEHGIGRLKTAYLPDWRGGAELWAMQAIKRALDPSGTLNPGKVLPPG